jgi:integrase
MKDKKKKNIFTDKGIKAEKPLEGQVKPRDIRENKGEGFALTVFPSGKKSFVYIYHFNGRKRRMTLGKCSQLSLAEAKVLHREALMILSSGKDPADEKRREKIAVRDSSTVEGLIEEYLEKWARPNKRSWKADERCLYKDVKPYWGKLKAADITRRDVVLLLDRIKDRGAPIAANRALACIRRMFSFGIERDIISANPCAAVKAVAKENRCDRVLSEEEIKILWSALDQNTNQDNPLHVIHMSAETKLVLKLQLATAQRKGEVVAAEWDELDLVTGWWTIPAIKAKNNQTHRVPLSSLAIALLDEIKQLSGSSRFLFPAKLKDTHITGSSIDHAVRRCIFNGLKPWTPHDCRRTAASYMTSLGISRLVVSKKLNQSESSSITAVYDCHSYDHEKRHALEQWAKELRKIVYGVECVNNITVLQEAI